MVEGRAPRAQVRRGVADARGCRKRGVPLVLLVLLVLVLVLVLVLALVQVVLVLVLESWCWYWCWYWCWCWCRCWCRSCPIVHVSPAAAAGGGYARRRVQRRHARLRSIIAGHGDVGEDV